MGTCDANRWIGFGCYVGPDAMNRIVFHPGMEGGQMRIEGPGGSHENQYMGFTPLAYPQGFTKFTVYLKKGGPQQVEARNAQGETFKMEWSNPNLWREDQERSPPFGIYAGDIERPGTLYYKNFSVASAVPNTTIPIDVTF